MNISSEAMFETSDFFRVIFIRPPAGFAADQYAAQETREKTGEKTREKTGEKTLGFIREMPSISAEELAEKAGISAKGVEWQLSRLRHAGILRRAGPAKGGRWEAARKEGGAEP